MAKRNNENTTHIDTEYGYRLNISRERAGYSPNGDEKDLQESSVSMIILHLINLLTSNKNQDNYQK